jgi:hypothetical protein
MSVGSLSSLGSTNSKRSRTDCKYVIFFLAVCQQGGGLCLAPELAADDVLEEEHHSLKGH